MTLLRAVKLRRAKKDIFFKYLPFAVANAITWGFRYQCPGSRHMYTALWKSRLYMARWRWLVVAVAVSRFVTRRPLPLPAAARRPALSRSLSRSSPTVH